MAGVPSNLQSFSSFSVSELCLHGRANKSSSLSFNPPSDSLLNIFGKLHSASSSSSLSSQSPHLDLRSPFIGSSIRNEDTNFLKSDPSAGSKLKIRRTKSAISASAADRTVGNSSSSNSSRAADSTTNQKQSAVHNVLFPGGSPRLSPGLVECFEVEHCNKLEGHVHVSGAKNSALAVLAGALCSEEPLVLRRVPDLHDIRRMFQVLQSLGVKIERGVDGLDTSVSVDASVLTSVEPCPDVVRKLRASFFVFGAIMGRQGEAVVPLPGGCNIGARPIDLHVRGLEALGADVSIRQGRVYAKAQNGRLKGGNFHLDYPSVGATETLMMAAALADGETILSNVAQEPEVVDLANFLKSCGALIKGAGTNTLVIKGVRKLRGTDFTVIPDRIEAGTFLVAAAITRSAITMSPVIPHHLTAVISKLQAIGCTIRQTDVGCLHISAKDRKLEAQDVTTLPYPGIPTDIQPQMMALLPTCEGSSIVRETVFESRMRHVEELQKMGADIKVTGSTAFVCGRDQGSCLYGVPVTATDLRAGAALVLAGMAAEGITHIEGVSHIDRGYEKLDNKLRSLGARIRRLPCLPAELNL